ncbi:unnamed protein product [Alopecurus aequalis]
MRPTMALLVLLTIALVLSGTGATVETICKEASYMDARVNYTFCVLELANSRWAPDADPWGLAKAAADVGINNAYLAINDIEVLEAKPGIDVKTREALGKCDPFYVSMKFAFARANDRINERDYAAGKEEAAKAILLAHQCDDVFEKAAIVSPLTQRSIFSVRIAIVCTAITNLIQ